MKNQPCYTPHYTPCSSRRARPGPRGLWWIAAGALLVGGCEAKLDLTGVTRTQQEVVRRTDQLLGIQRTATGSLVVFGNNGLILRRASTSSHWQRIELTPATPNFIDATACPDGTLGGLSDERGLWLSEDDGLNWTHSALPLEEDLQAITCTPDNILWIVGSFSSLINTPDHGTTWIDQSLGEDAMLTSITFTSADEGFAAGEFGIFMTTRDGGMTWQRQHPIQKDFYTLTLHFKDSQTGWAGSLNGVIMATTDGGQTWRKQSTETDAPIYGFVETEAALFALGNQSTLLALDNGRWLLRPVPTDVPTYLRKGVALGDTLLIVGGQGTLLSLPLVDATNPAPLADATKGTRASHVTHN